MGSMGGAGLAPAPPDGEYPSGGVGASVQRTWILLTCFRQPSPAGRQMKKLGHAPASVHHMPHEISVASADATGSASATVNELTSRSAISSLCLLIGRLP